MRLAVSIRQTEGAAAWRSLAREVESIGFDVLHLADHLVDGLPTPAVALAVAAEATERLVVGEMVRAVDFRHPALLAREAAMLADLSGGRYELGLGAGHAKAEWDAVGLPFDDPGVRVGRLDEAVQILRRLLAGETVTFAGEHYELTEHRTWPVPATPPPILVGGNGDRVLGIAARHADIVGYTGFGAKPAGAGMSLTHFSAAGMDDRVAYVRAQAGGRPLRAQVLVQLVVVTPDRRSVAADLAGRFGVEADDLLEAPFLLLGTHEQMAEQLHERSARWDVETWTVFDSIPGTDMTLTTLVPVIELLHH